MSGGGNVSAMGAVAAGARARGGRTVGVIPKALVHRELADADADELIVTDTMRERKQIMEDRADAFIALPGGIGTLEELFETWTAGYLGMHDKPVVHARSRRPLRRSAGMAATGWSTPDTSHGRAGPVGGGRRRRRGAGLCAPGDDRVTSAIGLARMTDDDIARRPSDCSTSPPGCPAVLMTRRRSCAA